MLLTVRPSSGQWTWLQRSSVPLSHPSWTSSLHDAPAKPTASWRTPPTPPTVSSRSYHQEDGTGASEPAPPDCSTAFSPRLWEPWTQITPPPSETPCKPLPPETWTPPPPTKHPTPNTQHPTPNTLQPYHTKEKTVNFFVQFKCATHRWVGLYKPPVAAHSPLCTRHFSYTIPQKTQRYMYVYMLMHYHKSFCTVPQLAADSQCFSLHMYSIYVKHSHSLYSLYFLSLSLVV